MASGKPAARPLPRSTGLAGAAAPAARDAWRPKRAPMLRRFLRDRAAVAGLVILFGFVVTALAAPVLAPYDPTEVDARAILAPASADHWLGTDNLGRDLLSRLIYGARWTLG